MAYCALETMKELLQGFNESIGYALLRKMQSAINKLDAIDEELENHQSGSSPSEDDIANIKVKGGSTYVRWGRTSCGNTSELIYTGFAAGSHYTHTGGASNYQCLPLQPEYSTYVGSNSGAPIYGAEYESGSSIFPQSMQDHNVPCARCYAPSRSAIMMMPARRSCPLSWTKEYEGYLMAGHYSHKRAYAYECMDAEPEASAGGSGNINGALFYFQRASCGSIHCPPYIDDAQLTCVVCSK